MPSYNTGEQLREQRDVNPNSPTFGQTRWISAGQNLTACPLPTASYRSAEISQVVYRSDCGTGTSSGVTYTLAAGEVTSTTSQSDADARALALFNSTKEAYAQQHATCTTVVREVWVASASYNSTGSRLVFKFQRTDTSGTLYLDFTYSMEGVGYSGTTHIADGDTIGTYITLPPNAASGLESIDDTTIVSVTPNTYTIRP